MAQEPFSRFELEDGPDTGDLSPKAIIEQARELDLEAALAAIRRTDDDYFGLDELIDIELADTQHRHGAAPSVAEVKAGAVEGHPIRDAWDLDRWLLKWELAQPTDGKPEDARFPWFEQEPAVLMLLPVATGWETLAYITFYGMYFGAPNYLAVARSWEERFGAELYANFGTMLEFFVSRPPTEPDVALELAYEHHRYAECTTALPCMSLRHYALGLVDHDRWFLHERP